MSFMTDLKEFTANGLGKARNFADQYVDIQLENALNKERLRNVNQDSGTYVPSDLERERQFANASFTPESLLSGDPILGLPPVVAIGGALLAVVLVMRNG